MMDDEQANYEVVLTDHVFDKVRSIDMTLAEFEQLVDLGDVIETVPVDDGVKELLLVLERTRPLHVVVVVDDLRRERRIVTVYEPDPQQRSTDFRHRRR